MDNKIDISNELTGLSPLLAGMEKVNVFTVPPGYFEGLSERILVMVSAEERTRFLSDQGQQNTFEVPAGYFDNLADSILNRIRAQENETAAEELRTLSPMLYSIQNENVFEVPRGYFETLAESMLVKVKPQQPKVVTMLTRSRIFIKYAVAASFTGMMALGVFKFTQKTDSILPGYVVEGSKPHNVDEELSKVADEDIIRYLQTNAEDFDAQAVASKSINENELPSQADYFTDDKALDKYLNNINTNDLKN